MLKADIGGTFFKLIYSIYIHIKFLLKKESSLGDIVNSYRAVKQGDGLNPLPFNVFINDLNSMFVS